MILVIIEAHTVNRSILHSGSAAQDQVDSGNNGCRILMFRWSLGPHLGDSVSWLSWLPSSAFFRVRFNVGGSSQT